MSESYVPYTEFEVTLTIHVPLGEPLPLEWDWAALTDMLDEDIQFHSQRVVRTYNRDDDE